MKYLIENLNGGEPIIDPVLRWTFAGFYKDRVENIVVHIEFTTEEEVFSEAFSCSLEVKGREDSDIENLMHYLLETYIIN